MKKDKCLKIVIASDSFKGSLGSLEVAEAAARGIRSVVPDAGICCLAVADGGEGTSDTLIRALGGNLMTCRADDPLGRPVDASYGIVNLPEGTTAIIDMASASGLPLLRPEERNVMITSTAGTGQMILDAYRHGCRRFVIGIGGSATCDGGTGMLSALGIRLLDNDGNMLAPGGGALQNLASVDMSEAMTEVIDCTFTIICDVTNPLCGPEGSARVFGPQKGATPAQVEELEAAMQRYASVVAAATGSDVADTPGAGAAGGLGAAFLAFFNSELKTGVDAVLDLVGFDEAVRDADLVITGEGKIDRQTLYGKLPYGVCQRAAAAGVPTVAIAGCVEGATDLLKGGFAGVFPILHRPVTLAEALDADEAAPNISAVAAAIVNLMRNF